MAGEYYLQDKITRVKKNQNLKYGVSAMEKMETEIKSSRRIMSKSIT